VARKILLAGGLLVLAAIALVYTPPPPPPPPQGSGPDPTIRPHEPPVTVHDGSLKVEFRNKPTISPSGLYTVGYLYSTPVYVSSDFTPPPKPTGTASAKEPSCIVGTADCPDLQLPWKIVVCDLNLDQTRGPDNEVTCHHGIVACSPGNPDSACRPKDAPISASTTITVFSINNELHQVSDKIYQNLDSDDEDASKCEDNWGHRCDFPGTLVITQGSGKTAKTDTYACGSTRTDVDQICRVEVGELQPKASMLTYLLKKM
jgi:hypothetical protein